MLIKGKHLWQGPQSSGLTPSFWDLKLQAQIGRGLRDQYEHTMREPLPEHLAALLEQLEQRERASGLNRAYELT